MKYLYLALICASTAIAQISDDFSDGDFTQNPMWFGMPNNFEIDSQNRLHLNAPSQNSSSFLCLKSQILEDALWELDLKMDFNPSSSNYLDWYLFASDSLLKNASEGYFVRVGNSEDELSLYRQENGEVTKIIDGLDGRVSLSSLDIRLKVERSLGGTFSLWVDLKDDNGWILEGEAQDSQITTAEYSGIHCTYTATRSTKFYFDNFLIEGETLIDSLAPALNSAEVYENNKILLRFEDYDFGMLNTSQFKILPHNLIPNSIIQNENELSLLFSNTLPVNQAFQLNISTLSDTSGNIMNDTLLDFYIQKHKQFDILIHELMIDPTPEVQLPQAEYIELYNTAEYSLNLLGWKLLIDESIYAFNSINLPAHSYLVLINEGDSALFEAHNFQSISLADLNNTEGYIALIDSSSMLVHDVLYDKSWYQNSNKENGGWSLEMMDCANYCTGKNNWRACENNLGGSPGFENSIQQENPDTTAPSLQEIIVSEENEISLLWSENLYDSVIYFPNSYLFSSALSPIAINHFMNQTTIQFLDDLEEGIFYKIHIDSLNDCQENTTAIFSEFILGSWPKRGQIFINEVLFNPKSDGYDYVELYNNSDHYIDLSKLLLGNYDSLLNDIVFPEIISENRVNFPPNSYLALCENSSWIKANYYSDSSLFFLEVEQLPSLPNSEGTLALSSISYELIDALSYTETDHFSLLDDLNGVALERLTIEDKQWFSAASTENYGTPARQNSQFVYPQQNHAKLSVMPEVFSPNHDGNKDFTSITLQNENPVKVNISIYNKRGFVIRELCHSAFVNQKAVWIWDGLDENQLKLPIGLYMVIVELIDEDRNRNQLKHPIVISEY